jgi:hypothetical protein
MTIQTGMLRHTVVPIYHDQDDKRRGQPNGAHSGCI